ncbi:MAG: protein-glutamate methylesterase/protein-glutamine glutaminase [Nitrospinota bacterium]
MIKVLIIDDSAIVCKVLNGILSEAEDIEVIGSASDPYEARAMIVDHKPDVITLDIEMPRMDGTSFLKILMKHYPIPTVMISSLTKEGAEITLQALELGAVDFLAKPVLSKENIAEISLELIDKIYAASKVDIGKISNRVQNEGSLTLPDLFMTDKIIAIGASIGGTNALRNLLSAMPSNSPPILVTQHMTAGFTKSFAKRLDSICKVEVREAKMNDQLKRGVCLIAPGSGHMRLKKVAGKDVVDISDEELICGHRPSVEVLFESMANVAKKRGIGIMLTGMGSDGANAMLAMKNNGGYNIAQDEATSLVFGMPKEAIKLGGVDQVAPLDKIGELVIKQLIG